jgi:hypothetical protein
MARPRALFFVLLLLLVLVVLYGWHLRNENMRTTNSTKGTSQHAALSALLSLFSGTPDTENPLPERLPLSQPQNIGVRFDNDVLRATEIVRLGAGTVSDARFGYHADGDWMIIDSIHTGNTEKPCRGVMRKGSSRLAIVTCGIEMEKTDKENSKNLKNE